MIADPVFADMLSEPTSTETGSTDSHQHSHSHDHGHSHSHSHSGSQPASSSTVGKDSKPNQGDIDLSQDKVRSTLRSFVRDWSVEGTEEREACYTPILEVLERKYPKSMHGSGRERSEIRVLVPGCGLGRLAMEVAARGESMPTLDRNAYLRSTSPLLTII
jgi:carnosine N-methyltransferase